MNEKRTDERKRQEAQLIWGFRGLPAEGCRELVNLAVLGRALAGPRGCKKASRGCQ
jgi:hypothetical protein